MDSSLYNSVEKSLEYKFLYNNDIDSIHILLSVLENKCDHFDVKPKYNLMKYISYSLYRTLIFRKDRDYIIYTLKKLINDGVNRLELSINIEAYSNGFYTNDFVDKLERFALKHYSCETLEHSKKLFCQSELEDVKDLKEEIFVSLEENSSVFENLEKIRKYFCQNNLKSYVYSLNEFMSSQLIIDEDNPGQLKLEGKMLTLAELNLIYDKLEEYLIRNIKKIYKMYFWYGINDSVLKRYQ